MRPFFVVLALLTAGAAGAQTPPTLDAPAPRRTNLPRNVVLMIADGFGPASVTLGAAAKGAPLAFDSVLVGSVETSATDSRVTDSAAGATAYACGLKTYNGAIGVDDAGAPCRTVLEAAGARGLATGLVATSRITHATPASFASHVPQRADEAEIARQLAASGVDLMVGGGLRFFDREALGALAARGAAVATDRAGYDALNGLPAAALLAPDHLAYEIDRDETDQPALAEMATRALDLLSASAEGRENGFFLMIEGSRIDHAAHGNDPAGHLGDILAYDAAVAAVLAWAAADGHTLVVSTADHETGGMTLGRDGVYAWDPAPLLAAPFSAEAVAQVDRARLAALPATATEADSAAVTSGLLEDGLGTVTESERAVLAATDAAPDARYKRVLSERARIGWTTGGHTAVDVNLYAFGPGAERFHGRMSNAAVGRALFDALGLPVDG